MHPIEPEEEDYLLCPFLDLDGLYTEETFGDRLHLFYRQFNSSTRALLDDALFRETVENSVVTGLEILCKNQIVYKRLIQKHQKIANEIRWIWPETATQFSVWSNFPQIRVKQFGVVSGHQHDPILDR
jgi:hypothetical protein